MKVRQITEDSFSIIGLKNSSREDTNIYIKKKELMALSYAIEQALLKSNIKNGRV